RDVLYSSSSFPVSWVTADSVALARRGAPVNHTPVGATYHRSFTPRTTPTHRARLSPLACRRCRSLLPDCRTPRITPGARPPFCPGIATNGRGSMRPAIRTTWRPDGGPLRSPDESRPRRLPRGWDRRCERPTHRAADAP